MAHTVSTDEYSAQPGTEALLRRPEAYLVHDKVYIRKPHNKHGGFLRSIVLFVFPSVSCMKQNIARQRPIQFMI